MPALYTAIAICATLCGYSLLKGDFLLLVGSLVTIGLMFFVKFGVELSIDEAYKKGCDDNRPQKEKVDNRVVETVIMAYELFEKGLQIAVPANEDPDSPRKLLVGKWEVNPFDRNRSVFMEVGLINRTGFRPIRRVEKKVETTPKPSTQTYHSDVPPNFPPEPKAPYRRR